jgi:hypothetical protein
MRTAHASPPIPVRLPKRKRGRQSIAQQAKYDAQVDAFIQRLHEIDSTLDFKVGTRGWCYLAANESMVGKDEFDAMEKLLGDWRKSGQLPLKFCANDDKRAPENLEEIDREDPGDYAEVYARVAAKCWQHYLPFSFWDFQPVYIEQADEKTDLVSLFAKVCAEYHIPIWNAGGWSDINSRADLMIRFQEHDEAGRRCVLLYCGDFDPAGLLISETIRKNLKDLEATVGWCPDGLVIDHFGLNEDFIQKHRIPWIEGLKTGSGKYNLEDPRHPDHWKPYVQNYLKKYGARKVEANALVARHEAGRQLCREAILKYIDPDGIRRYQERLREERQKVRAALPTALETVLADMSEGDSND